MENIKPLNSEEAKMKNADFDSTNPGVLDEAFRVEDAIADAMAVLDAKADVLTQKFNVINLAHRFFWTGKDISGGEHSGSANTTGDCYAAAALSGAVTCSPAGNPSFVEPKTVIPEPKPVSAFEANDFYAQGYADGDAAYQDIKLLILAWVSEQMLSSSLNMAQDIDAIPFVVYARHNR